MSSKVVAESAAQLVVRVSSEQRPQLDSLSADLFPDNGPSSGQMIEIAGDTSTGKSHFLMEIMAKVILPVEYGGRNSRVVFFDLDHSFRISRFMHILEKIACGTCANDTERVTKQILENCLSNLLVYNNCYTLEAYELAMMDFDNVITENSRIALVAFDSIFAFYWIECKQRGATKIDSYYKKTLKKLRKICRDHKIVCAFTRQSCYAVGTIQETIGEMISADYKICLKDEEEILGFRANTEINGKTYTKFFVIDNFGMRFFEVELIKD